jgi:2,5-diamino-6-(ribosylamino)-4(3H)-pyrimidinone 5'-phosphate reductase
MSVSVKPDYTNLDLPTLPADRPYVLINMVSSVDGKIVIEGTEQGIGTKTDQRLMRELRVNADVILNGAATLRASGASPRMADPALEALRIERGKPRFAISSVVSRSGNLPLERIFFTAEDFQAVVYLAEDAPAGRRAAIEATGRTVVTVPPIDTIPAILRHMHHDLGASVLLLEGGADLNAQFFAAGLVDEIFLTLGPVIVAGNETKTAVEGPAAFTRDTAPRLDLLSAVPNPATGEVYLRYRVRR